MWTIRRGLVIGCVVIVVGAAAVWWFVTRPGAPGMPGCTATLAADGGTSQSASADSWPLTPEQAANAATIAAVGGKLGMPDRAVTVALATAMQESKLVNLPGGDRDSAGLFQQRPSMGWGSYDQVVDPVYAATTFYQHLRKKSGWEQLSVSDAAQAVQRSAAPDAYAKWEPEARAVASALTGETAAGLTCANLTIGPPSTSLATAASNELGTSTLTGGQNQARGWAISSWLVAHAQRFGVDQVSFNGQTWTSASGSWSQTGGANGQLSLHQVSATSPASR